MKSTGFFRCLFAVFLWFGLGLAARAQTSLPAAQVGQAYTYTITTTPAAPAGTVYTATGLPAGLSINASSGTISGTPTAAGTYTGVLSLTADGLTDNLDYSLVVNAALGTPAITSASTAAATVGQAFSYTVTASNTPTSFNVGALPAGLSFNSGTTQIEGTPTSAGSYTVALSANNASGTGVAVNLAITVNPAGPVPAINSATTYAAVPTGDPAEFTVNYQITASNSPASYAASGLPFGLSVDSTTGLISGTTTTQGVHTVALTATNNNGTGPATDLTLTVGALSAITSAGPLNLTVGQAMTAFALAASNSPQSFNVTGLPPGLSATTAGVISGTPTAIGTSNVSVSANNAVGTGPVATVTITVAAAGGGGGGGGGGGQAPAITSASTANAVLNQPFTFTVTASPAATSFAAAGLPAGLSINAATGAIGGTPTAIGVSTVTLTATNSSGSGFGTLTLTVNSRPAITTQPQGASVAPGGSVTLSVAATGTPAPTYQWRKNGVVITGAVGTSLTLSGIGAGDAASYTVAVTNVAGTTVSQAAVVGLVSTAKVAGAGTALGQDIVHPNGNVYDQVLLTGAAAAITADANQITRISFIDLNDDIVQIELSGPGTLALTLENATGPAAPTRYNQPGVQYMKGHASLVITGATANTHVSAFSVGTLTAVNQTLFPAGQTYDGMADIGLLSIVSADGKFGGIRMGNVSYFRASGLTGIHAPGVAVEGPTYVGDINADTDATPVLLFGSTTDVRITGGNLLQANARAVQVDGLTRVDFTAGTTSAGTALPAQTNAARFEKGGVDVTSSLVPPN